MTRPPLEVADIVRQYGDAYLGCVPPFTRLSVTIVRICH